MKIKEIIFIIKGIKVFSIAKNALVNTKLKDWKRIEIDRILKAPATINSFSSEKLLFQ